MRNGDLRYVAKMEIYAAMDSADEDEPDDDRDHLLEINEILDSIDDADFDSVGEDIYKSSQFDLCPECQRKVLENPLGRQQAPQFNFSAN